MNDEAGPRFGRVLTAMITPFDDDGALDLNAAATLADWLVANGSDGLVLAGTTGESPTLTHSEEVALARAVKTAVEVPVLLGTGSNDTRFALDATREAEALGVDGILVVGPYYNRPSQAGLYEHFSQIARVTELPVMIYDIPARTGRKIDTSTLLRLAHEHSNVVALKDAAGDPAETAQLILNAPSRFEVYSGDDALTLPLLSVGAVGAVSVASHWCGREIGTMIAAYCEGRVADAAAINRRLIPSYQFESHLDAPNPVPTKAMMRVIGQKVGRCRLPMGPEPEWLDDLARDVLAGLA